MSAQKAGVGPRSGSHRRHLARPGTWTRERIVGSIHAWVAETGRPPTARDWRGSPGGSSRWAREHPRWPSYVTVARHFDGAWSRALSEAGYPPRVGRNRVPLRVRVLTAQQLAQHGHSTAEIAGHLGVGQVTAWRYLRAMSCVECRERVVTGVALCKTCAVEARPGSAWSAGQVLQAIQGWTHAAGSTPTFRDWMPASASQEPNRWEREWPRWPHSSAVYTHFGTWTDALAQAGLRRRFHGRWTDAQMLDAITAWTRAHGAPPSISDFAHATHEHPVASTVKARFGRWSSALAAAGVLRP